MMHAPTADRKPENVVNLYEMPTYKLYTSFDMPKGIWRKLSKEAKASMAQLSGSFLYANCKDTVQQFCDVCTDNYKISHSAEGHIAVPSWPFSWSAHAWESIHDNSFVFSRPHLRDTETEYYLGWLKLPLGVSLHGPQSANVEYVSSKGSLSFRADLGRHHIHIYSSMDLQSLLQFDWSFGVPFKVTTPVRQIEVMLEWFECDVCYGLHEDGSCPFGSLKRSNPKDSSPEGHLGKRARLMGPVLLRSNLVKDIIARAQRDGFILIEAPPCSGKSTLLGQLRESILSEFPSHILHYTDTWPDPTDTVIMVYHPRFRHNDPQEHNPESARKDLIEFIKPSNQIPFVGFWVLVDESQKTYGDLEFWSSLYEFHAKNVWVIAAGSYGSHTGSSSHSPPPMIKPEHRMNLFSRGTDRGLAFTKDEFNDFLHQIDVTDKLAPFQQHIQDYASPCGDEEGWEPGMHPGVVARMAKTYIEKLNRAKDSTLDDLTQDFNEECLKDASAKIPLTLGRAIPRLPANGLFGYPPAAMLVFAAVLEGFVVIVPAVDDKRNPTVVKNFMQHEARVPRWSRTYTSEAVKPDEIPDGYRRESAPQPDASNDNSFLVNIRRFVEDERIALTPRERLIEVVHSKTTAKPYSLRQYHDANKPLTDFEQAAHDARRMGWLLQVPWENAENTKLVLPTMWHRHYLRYFLQAEVGKVPQAVAELSFDDFLVKVIGLFRASVIRGHIHQAEKLKEVVVNTEFMHAARELAKDPMYLLPQVRTKNGDGILDFLVLHKKWLIEVMCEGDDVEGHISRFDSGKGAYGQNWPGYEWRVLDFRANVMPRKDRTCNQYRTIIFLVEGSLMRAVYNGSGIQTPISLTLRG